MKYDLIIIGAGPAGLTAGLYATRYKLKVLIIGKIMGGLAGEANEVCNFPSHEKITGIELMRKMVEQVKKMNVEIKQEDVLDIKKQEKAGFEIFTNKGKYSSEKIVLATGSERGKLGLDKENEFVGKGVSYCATCDAGFYKDKTVGIVGGSDASLTAALLLAKFAKKVYIIYRKDKFFRAEPTWVEEVKKNKKITPIFNSNITKLIGKNNLEEVELDNKKKLKLDGIFIEIGSVQNIELSKKLGVKMEDNFIKVDKKQKTNVKGVFAAGDITNNPLKQIITACGEGAIAADSAYNELK